ncbi:exo-beta-N-acetylmuramidase NamZ domain-containing protein [Paenibacillus sp. 2TAF8]|uniref:exo-beta-N-acetylmuramidase NamZ family protein n=1 Tax=Paenibacillus sp. 2TAF8 TaxID=3233020 RepID=UPI003F96E29B
MSVKTGADILAEGSAHPWLSGGARLGLVTNPTGIMADFVSTVDVCAGLADTRLMALFACEHGLNGELQAGVPFADSVHPRYGIPVYSLYGTDKRPLPSMLAEVDTILFDIQDVGVRYYTYASTLFQMMEACGKAGKRLLVMDRPNPLGGMEVEGGLLKEGYESFVGAWTTPIRTGMTIGELALLVNAEHPEPCSLEVIAMEGWRRMMSFAETGLPWMMPSPNMPTVDTVRAYAGTCLFEGTNVSEGRGTTRPFEWIGAPWINGERLADAMQKHRLHGVHFHPVYMTPAFSKHAGELCGGVRIFVTDETEFRSVETGLLLLHEIAVGYSAQFEWLEPPREGSRYFIDLLTGSAEVRDVIGDINRLSGLMALWREQEQVWRERRTPFLIYD